MRALAEAIEDLAADVSTLRAQVATLRGKTAVQAREAKKRRLKDPELALIEQMTEGKVVAEFDPTSRQYTLPSVVEEDVDDHGTEPR